jgi:hypothetical protein
MNARRHGLAAKIVATSTAGVEVKVIAAVLAGPNPEPVRRHFAMKAAEAEVELFRIEVARARVSSMAEPSSSSRGNMQTYAQALPVLLRLERYKQRAISQRNRALSCL